MKTTIKIAVLLTMSLAFTSCGMTPHTGPGAERKNARDAEGLATYASMFAPIILQAAAFGGAR